MEDYADYDDNLCNHIKICVIISKMPKIKIEKDKCKGCMLCISVCRQGLISKSKKFNKCGVKFVEFSEQGDKKCTGCSMCAIICPETCIEVHK